MKTRSKLNRCVADTHASLEVAPHSLTHASLEVAPHRHIPVAQELPCVDTSGKLFAAYMNCNLSLFYIEYITQSSMIREKRQEID